VLRAEHVGGGQDWESDHLEPFLFFRLYYNLLAELLLPIGRKSGNLL